MVLKKMLAAGDITATEITIALVRPSAPRRNVVCAPPNSPAAGITVASELSPAGVVVSDMRHLHFHSLVHHHQSKLKSKESARGPPPDQPPVSQPPVSQPPRRRGHANNR